MFLLVGFEVEVDSVFANVDVIDFDCWIFASGVTLKFVYVLCRMYMYM